MMAVTHCRRTNTLVVFLFYGPQDQIFSLALFRNFFQNILILGRRCTAPDNQRYIDGSQYFFDGCCRIFRRSIIVVGVNAFQLKDNDFCVKLLNAFFCPGSRIGDNILKRCQSCFRPVLGFHVPDFHCYDGFIRHLSFKLIKRITCFGTNRQGVVTFSNGDSFNCTGIGFFGNVKSHFYLLMV